MSADVLSVRLRMRPVRPNDFDLDVAFDVPPGLTVLFGPSGSGKSTTLAAIAGLVRPDEGRIACGDQVWFDRRAGGAREVETPIHRRGVSFVFQSLALFPHLTARGNVEFGIDRTLPRAERRRRAEEMLVRMKVGHLTHRRPGTFSGGEAQRVALARAFARTPRLVLLDEAFSAMDREAPGELGAEIRAYVEAHGIPAILVTHHRMEARAMAERAVVLAGGRVQGVGPIHEVIEGLHAPDAGEDPWQAGGAA